MCHTCPRLAAHYTHWGWQCLTHKHTHKKRLLDTSPTLSKCLWVCVAYVICVCKKMSTCFLCGIKASLPFRRNVYVFQYAYLKPRQRKRRRTIGKRRDRNAVGTLDETADIISGTFTHQVKQAEKKQGIFLSQVRTIQNVCLAFQKHAYSHQQTNYANHGLSPKLDPAVQLTQINLAIRG